MDTLKDWHGQVGGRGEAWAPTGCMFEDYGDPRGEVRAAREGALVVDRSRCARIQLSGKDRRDLVQRLGTNDVEKLAAGEGRPTVFINAKGRIIDRVVLHAADDGDIMVGSADRADALLEWMRGYIIREDVELQDLTGATAQLEVLGPRALEVLHAPLLEFSRLHELMIIDCAGVNVLACRTDPLAVTTVRLIMPRHLAPQVIEYLVSRGGTLGGAHAWNVMRLQGGMPLHGPELNDERNPLEAGLVDAIHFNKGCYVGQEVVARVDTYMKQRRYLVALDVDGPPPAPGTRVQRGTDEGEVTSSAATGENTSRALAYLKSGELTPGMSVELVEAGGTVRSAVIGRRAAQAPPPAGGEGNQAAAVA